MPIRGGQNSGHPGKMVEPAAPAARPSSMNVEPGTSRRSSRASRLAVGAVIGLLVLAVTGCGPGGAASSGDHRHPATSTSAICTRVGSLNRLVVQRALVSTQGKHPRFTFPARVIVTGTAVRHAARGFCASARALPASHGCAIPATKGHGCEVTPATPARISSPCPVSILVNYSLTFWAGPRRFPGMSADPGICPHSAPWVALGQAMRIPHPGVLAFTGGVGA